MVEELVDWLVLLGVVVGYMAFNVWLGRRLKRSKKLG